MPYYQLKSFYGSTRFEGEAANLSAAIIETNKEWTAKDLDLNDRDLRDEGGLRYLNLTGAYFMRSNFRSLYLYDAMLNNAHLIEADLRYAKLARASLIAAQCQGACFAGALLDGANLSYADLRRADLSGCNLSLVNLRGASLENANLTGCILPDYSICPDEGEFFGYKQFRNGSVGKLRIPAEAKRTSTLVGRKCRAEMAELVSLSFRGRPVDDRVVYSMRDGTRWEVGQITRPDAYNDDIRVECTHGIHFFVTEKEAREY